MLTKLLKHEFRATARTMLPLFVFVIFTSFLAHFAVRLLDRETLPAVVTILLILIMVMFVTGMLALGIVSLVIMIRRFRVNILGDEGYLTMTLPASVHSIVWAKIIVSIVWYVAAALVGALALFIVTFRVNYLSEMASFIRDLFRDATGRDIADFSVMFLELAGVALLAGIASCLSFYASLSVGHGFAKNKMLLSIVAYLVMTTVMGWLTGYAIQAVVKVSERIHPDSFTLTQRMWHMDMGIFALTALAEGVIYYVITVLNLKKRLNLE